MPVQTSTDRVAALVDRQYGAVSRRQLLALGVTASMVETRLRRGTLVQLHRGVYAVGHRRLRREGQRVAALLACGPGAALSHREAAALHGLGSSGSDRIDVTATRRVRRPPPGVEVHHRVVLEERDVERIDGMPVTTVARTLVDLAGVVPSEQLAKALREAEHLRTIDMTQLRDAMQRTRTRKGPGHARLTAVLAEHRRRGLQLTRSDLEDRFVALLDAHGLPLPRTNFHVAGQEVDAAWPAALLAVELDGWARHKDRYAFQRDREKGNALTRAGWRLLRFTHDDVVRRPAETAADVRRMLADA